MSLYKLSPNEEDRLIKEETRKLRITRLKQVRKQAKAQSASLLKNVDEKKKFLHQIALNDLEMKWHKEHSEEVSEAEKNLKNSLLEIGESHRHAAEFDVDLITEEKALKETDNQNLALKRQKEALNNLRNVKEMNQSKDLQHLLSRFSALDMERARATMIASLPKPVPKPEPQVEPKKLKSSLRTTAKSNVVVEKENIDSNFPNMTASEQAEILEQKYESMEDRKKRIIEERRMKTLSRHMQALNKEHQDKEQQNLINDLQNHKKEEIAAKKSEVEKMSKQILMDNLKLKADKETHLKQRPHTPHVERNKTAMEVDATADVQNISDRTSELVCVTPPPSENLTSFDDTSDLIRTDIVNESGDEINAETENDDNLTQSDGSVTKVFHLDVYERKRLQQLVEMQKSCLSNAQRVQTTKKGASLQTNIEMSIPKMMHEAIQVVPDEQEIDIGNLSNSYIASLYSFEDEPDEPCMFPGGTWSLDEIRRKKEEIIKELMEIDEEIARVKQMGDGGHTICDGQPMGSSTNGQGSRQVDCDLKLLDSNSKTCGIPYVHHYNDESSMSSYSSTKYLDLPSSDTGTINDGNDSELNRPSKLSESKIKRVQEAKQDLCHATINQEHSVHSQNTSSSTDYFEIPCSNILPSEPSLDSSYKDLPSFSQIAATNLSTPHDHQKNAHAAPQIFLSGGGDGRFTSPNLSVPSSSHSKSLDDYCLDSSNIYSHFRFPPDQDISDQSHRREFMNLNNLIAHNESAIDIMSERASMISVHLNHSDTESTRLSMGCKSEPPKNIKRMFSTNSESLSLPFSFQNYNLQDILRNIMNSTIDIHSERASMISVEILDPTNGRFPSGSLAAKEMSHMKDYKYLRPDSPIGQSDSTSNESTLEDANGINSSNHSLNVADRNESQVTRDWAKILEPFRSKAKNDDECENNYCKDMTPLQTQVAEAGILEEPELTLVSANTTMSMAADSLQSSGLQSSSLLSFERHEDEICHQNLESSINTLCTGLDDKFRNYPDEIIKDTKTTRKSNKQGYHLMYPDKKETQKSLKETLESWAKSRTTTHNMESQPQVSKSNNPTSISKPR